MKTVAQAFLIGIFAIILVIAVSAIATLAHAEEAKPPAQDVRHICGCDFAACYRDPEQCKRGNVKPDGENGKGKGGDENGKGNG